MTVIIIWGIYGILAGAISAIVGVLALRWLYQTRVSYTTRPIPHMHQQGCSVCRVLPAIQKFYNEPTDSRPLLVAE